MASYFTADWHLNERRIGDIRTGCFNPFFRPFRSVTEQNDRIIDGLNSVVRPTDRLYVVGDVAIDREGVSLLDRIHCRNRTLIIGNYDTDKLDALASTFDAVVDQLELEIAGVPCLLQHYPARAVKDRFNIVGHIHGLWKVRPNMVNVGVDAWHFLPVSEQEIRFVYDAMRTGKYDENVFPIGRGV